MCLPVQVCFIAQGDERVADQLFALVLQLRCEVILPIPFDALSYARRAEVFGRSMNRRGIGFAILDGAVRLGLESAEPDHLVKFVVRQRHKRQILQAEMVQQATPGRPRIIANVFEFHGVHIRQ